LSESEHLLPEPYLLSKSLQNEHALLHSSIWMAGVKCIASLHIHRGNPKTISISGANLNRSRHRRARLACPARHRCSLSTRSPNSSFSSTWDSGARPVDIYAPHSHGFAAADGEVRGGRDCFGLFERLEHAGIKCTSQTSEGPAEPAVVVPWFQHVEVITA
jgi:hypothetical protein